MKLLLSLLPCLVVGLESSQVARLLVNSTENDPWIWVSHPEDDRIRSVFFYTEFEGGKCPAYDYKFDTDLVHPWAIREYLNDTLRISTITETNVNETVLESYRIKSLGSKVLVEPTSRVFTVSQNPSECEKLRRSMKYCLPTISYHNEQPINCSGRIIFTEKFGNKENPFKNWRHVVQSQLLEPDYEGVAFVNRQANSFVENNMLHLKVTKSNYGSKNPFYLQNCTYRDTDSNQRCGEKNYRPQFRKFFPPFDSAKLQSKDTFKYCRIDIEAKMPIGNLLFPGLTLTSIDQDAIRIAIVRGNKNLSDFASNEIGGSSLFAGAILIEGKGRPYEVEEFSSRSDHFGNDFHTYTAIWKERSIIFKVDGRTFAQIKNETVVKSLSQIERRIELFLTVGGEYNFPDNRIPTNFKSYRNFDTGLSFKIKDAVKKGTNWEQAEMIIKNINVFSTDEYED
ncbi:gram-negative bacteria-binding protein 2-like [Drosophila ficusphila]|uniref:gram-negative bacteria-binding protein 2-like n=1 Tax=Drosophila ficusphila TaxID=30025 RepID=UPI0007E68E20|nr:gram-negative bacteria-binding protein 2-like [Drosophila ficusphila]